MSTDSSKPGFGELVRGEGEDRLLNLCARVFALIVVFAAAVGCFWALGLG